MRHVVKEYVAHGQVDQDHLQRTDLDQFLRRRACSTTSAPAVPAAPARLISLTVFSSITLYPALRSHSIRKIVEVLEAEVHQQQIADRRRSRGSAWPRSTRRLLPWCQCRTEAVEDHVERSCVDGSVSAYWA